MKVTFSEEAELAQGTAPLGVADFLLGINSMLSRQYPRIEGEVTSVKDSYATAIYFTIKDTTRDALLNCVIWRTTYNQNGVQLKEGDAIIVTGTPEIYPARGTFSLKVSTIEYAGEGKLKRSYDELRSKLTSEGLLDPQQKRLLPEYPTRIGVITSRAGVVIQDFSANLGRYGFKVTLVDSRVEGKDAIHELLAALKTLAKADIEILVIMRGGGSWESLQAFNTESVVRAIAAFPFPVLTGIGHDVDVTLAELVADIGSSTPTAVAEKLNESWDTLASTLQSTERFIHSTCERIITRVERVYENALAVIPRRFERMVEGESRLLVQGGQLIQNHFRELHRRITSVSSTVQSATATLKASLRIVHAQIREIPLQLLRCTHVQMHSERTLLASRSACIMQIERSHVRTIATQLAVYEKVIRISDPCHNLKLGYSLTYAGDVIVRSIKGLTPGTIVKTHISDGYFTSEVNTIE